MRLQTVRLSSPLAISTHALLLSALSFGALDALADVTRRSTSQAMQSGVQYDGMGPAQKSFNFSAAKATLNKLGEWVIEGTIKHNGLLCGDYEVGMRFGIGAESCENVDWLTSEEYVATYTLCNNAVMPFRGMMQAPVLAEQYGVINCAERVVRCSGICK